MIGTLKFLCPSEGRNGARIANSNSRSECLVTGAEFVGTYCTKATPPSRLIVYARSWYRVQIWRALRLTEILTNSETPSELTLASNVPNVSRQNPLHLQMLPPAAVSGGTFRALSCPAIAVRLVCPAAWTSPMIRQDVGRILRRLRHTGDTHQLHSARRRLAYPIAGKPVSR